MATIFRKVCDFCSEQHDGQTLPIAIDSKTYEADICPEQKLLLVQRLQPFLEVSRSVPRGLALRTKPVAAPTAPKPSHRYPAPPTKEELTCKDCGQYFPNRQAISAHTRSLDDTRGGGCSGVMPTDFVCEECPRGFSQRVKYAEHMWDMHQQQIDDVVYCPQPNCGRPFAYEESLDRHIAKDHHLVKENA